jgi:hypothetical protein
VFTELCSFGEDAYGELYVCDRHGEVYKIVPSSPVLTGVQQFGTGTPGCAGAHAWLADCSPVIGSPAFAIRCTNAPPAGLGLLAFSSVADGPGSISAGLGVRLHVQLGAPFFALGAMLADAAGEGRVQFALPPTQGLVGVAVHAQTAWLWSPATCQPTPAGWSSSPGLTITLQP